MQFTESTPRQAEHFEWLNAIEFYQSYLEIMDQRLTAISQSNGSVDADKISAYEDMLDYLRERLHEMKAEVNQHLEEIETGNAEENRLEMVSQSGRHFGLKEKFDLFEDMLNGFRTEFNSFYVSSL